MDFSISYLNFVLVSILAVYIWESYLSLRQRKKLKQTNPSQILLNLKLTKKEEFQKSQKYGLDKNTFSFINNLKQNIITCFLLLSTYGYQYQWYIAGQLMFKFIKIKNEENNNNLIIQSLIFVLINNLFSNVIDIPFNLYNAFVIEAKHGFNKQTYAYPCTIHPYPVIHILIYP